jgi:urease accessory protein
MKNAVSGAAYGAAGAGALAMPMSAYAHHAMDGALPGNLLQGLVSGLAHPIIGLDHFLFVIALGAACHYFGRRAATAAVFVGGTLAGTVFHLLQATLAYPDVWVALSLLLLGAWFYAGHSFMKSYGMVVFFSLAGIAHGYAYGESIVGAEPTPMIAYLAGFTLVQLAVMFAASAAARYLDRTKPEFRGAHALGGIMSIAGVAFLALAFG